MAGATVVAAHAERFRIVGQGGGRKGRTLFKGLSPNATHLVAMRLGCLQRGFLQGVDFFRRLASAKLREPPIRAAIFDDGEQVGVARYLAADFLWWRVHQVRRMLVCAGEGGPIVEGEAAPECIVVGILSSLHSPVLWCGLGLAEGRGLVS